MSEIISFTLKKKKFKLKVKRCNSLEKFSGLMFNTRRNARALLFEFKKPKQLRIHSFFVFFPFLAVWLDEKNNVIDKKMVKPFKLSVRPRKAFNKLIEIPLNERYSRIIRLLVGD